MLFIKKAMAWFRKFTVVDAMIFELYLFTAAIVIAKLLPVVLTLNIWAYVIVLAIWLMIIFPALLKKTKWKRAMMDNYRKLSMWKISVYKILVMAATLLLLKLIPEMLIIDIVWYVGIACFGLGYLVALVFRK